MAEVVGTVASALTLASLFKVCIQAFDIVQTAKSQALDLRKILVKLQIEKCRLYIWGQSIGINSVTELKKEEIRNICPFPELVQETLCLILELFRDSQKLKEKYGCASLDDLNATDIAKQGLKTGVLQHLNASFDNFDIKSDDGARQFSLLGKTCWIIRDRKRFETFIHEVKYFVDSLQEITKDLQSPSAQHEMMSSRIANIDDVRTLDWVSEVCEADYPIFSDAASLKAETISETSTFGREIQDWKQTVILDNEDGESDTSSVETTIAGLEDMTVTELKHKFSSYLLRAKEARLEKKTSQNLPESPTSSAIPWEREIIRMDTRRWARSFDDERKKDPPIIEAELRINETILSSMAQAASDQDFVDESNAIMQWFKVISPAEQTTVFYKMGDHLSEDLDTTRFFALIQNYRLSKHLS